MNTLPPPSPPRSVWRMPMIERVELLGANVRRMFRTGAQSALVGVGMSDAGPVSLFDLDVARLGAFFVGGCVAWILTTLAAPPKS